MIYYTIKKIIFILICLFIVLNKSIGQTLQTPPRIEQNKVKINRQEVIWPGQTGNNVNRTATSIFTGGWSSLNMTVSEPGKEKKIYGLSKGAKDILYPRTSPVSEFGEVQLRYSSIGGSIVSRPVSYYFGDRILPPLKSEFGENLPEGLIDTPWRMKPHELKTVTKGEIRTNGENWEVGDKFILDHRETVNHVVVDLSSNGGVVNVSKAIQTINIYPSKAVLRKDEVLKFRNGAIFTVTDDLRIGSTQLKGILSISNLSHNLIGYTGDVYKPAEFKVINVSNGEVTEIELIDGGDYIGNFVGSIKTKIIAGNHDGSRNPKNLTIKANFNFDEFYWSEHAQSVFATESGVVPITWISKEPIEGDIKNYLDKGMKIYSPAPGNNYVLLEELYIISGASEKPIKKLFWNAHQNFDAPLIEIPQSGIKRINILYNKNVPEFVDSSSTYNGISENRTIWVDYGFMHALNVEGKVFVEYLGEIKPDGRSRFHLGYDIVDIVKNPPIKYVNTNLGEKLLPSDDYISDDSYTIVEDKNTAKSSDVGIYYNTELGTRSIYAERIMTPGQYYVAYWRKKDINDISWPVWRTNYTFSWPENPDDYRFYPREPVKNANEAKKTAIKLTSELTAEITYQTDQSENRAKITYDNKFYSILNDIIISGFPVRKENRALIRYRLNDGEVRYERIFSYLNSWVASNKNIIEGTITESGGVATINTTKKDHNYSVGQNIYIGGVTVDSKDLYNRKHKIIEITNNKDIKFNISSGAGNVIDKVEITNSLKDSWFLKNSDYSKNVLPIYLSKNAVIGERINPPSINEFGLVDGDESYVGYINKKQGVLYNINAYIDPLEEGYSSALKGSIIPVNKIPNISEKLQVWWFRKSQITDSHNNLWPSVIVDYELMWPHEENGYEAESAKNAIVLASNDGSGPLNSLKASGEIYYVNRRGGEYVVSGSKYKIGNHTNSGITVENLKSSLDIGDVLYFKNGGEFEVSSAAKIDDTTIKGHLINNEINKGERGFGIREGYNPNEEHAQIIGGQVFALRDDLNIVSGNNFSSEPYVLLEYKDSDDRPSMAAYQVLREQLENNLTFNFEVFAGDIIQPPMPLPLMEPPFKNGTNLNRQLGNLVISKSRVDTDGKLSAKLKHDSINIPVHYYKTKSLLNLDVSQSISTSPTMLYVTKQSFKIKTITQLGNKAKVEIEAPFEEALNDGDLINIFGSDQEYYNNNFTVESYDKNKNTFEISISGRTSLADSKSKYMYVVKFNDYKTKLEGYLTVNNIYYIKQSAISNKIITYTINDELNSLLAKKKGQTVIVENDDGIRWYPKVVANSNKTLIDLDFTEGGVMPLNSDNNLTLIIPLDSNALNMAKVKNRFKDTEIHTEKIIPSNPLAKNITYKDRKNNIWVFRGGHDEHDVPTFSMQYYYKTKVKNFWFPEFFHDDDINSVVQYTQFLRAKTSENAYYDINDFSLPIVYNAKWPVNVPVMRIAQTLTTPIYGLPSVSEQSSLKILYQSSEHSMNPPEKSVILHDPTKEKIYYFSNENKELLDSINKEVRSGLTYFPDLPPHLVKRLFYDPNRGDQGALVFKGEKINEIVGSDYLLLNTLSENDINDISKIYLGDSVKKKQTWKDLFSRAYIKTKGIVAKKAYLSHDQKIKIDYDNKQGIVHGDEIHIIGFTKDGSPYKTKVTKIDDVNKTIITDEISEDSKDKLKTSANNIIVLQVPNSVTNPSNDYLNGSLEYFGKVKQMPVDKAEGVSYYSPEHVMEVLDDDVAVNSYALTALGPGYGYVSLIAGDGEKFTSKGDPVSVYIIKVEPTLQQNELKVVSSENPLNEKVTIQQILDFAGNSDDFEFDWKIAQPQNGVPPTVYLYEIQEVYKGGKWNYIKYPKKSDINTILTLNNINTINNSIVISTDFSAINSINYSTVSEVQDYTSRLKFENVDDVNLLSVGNKITLSSVNDDVYLGSIASIQNTGNNKVIEVDIDLGERLEYRNINNLTEAFDPNTPHSILFNEFSVDSNMLDNSQEYFLAMELDNGSDVEVFLNSQLIISKFSSKSTVVDYVEIVSGGQNYQKEDRIRLIGGVPNSLTSYAEFVVKSVADGVVTELYRLSDGGNYFNPGKYQIAPLNNSDGLDVMNLDGGGGTGLKLNVKFKGTVNTPNINLPPDLDDSFDFAWKLDSSIIKKNNNIVVNVFGNNDIDTSQKLDVKIFSQLMQDRADPDKNPNSKWNTISSGDGSSSPTTNAVLGRKADILALIDNYVIMRYKAKNNTNYPIQSKKWSKWTEPQLVEGWIKRVLAGINPFNQRSKNLFSNRVNTGVSMLTQAGEKWEGDVALNLDNINDAGLIEIYETVLNRGKNLSIGNSPGINFGPANDALLLAAGYLNDLYNFLGNEAVADASNPTIGIGTADGELGSISTSMFSFKGQVGSLLEEELALNRGRDDLMMPGVRTSPAYNRLYWNYTRGIDSGEVIYSINYNINEDQDGDFDGVINAEDAQKMYPQGHGDAYGHYLTALKGYYKLIADNDFTWVPRTEAVLILGKPVAVDYFDERKFATTAARFASVGLKTAELTWRKDYKSNKNNGWGHLGSDVSKINEKTGVTRHWGFDHWASKTGTGTYMNWVIGNSMLPDKDPNPEHEGIQIIDRSTVPELMELSIHADELQNMMENAEGGLNPLGMNENTLALDLDPHFLEAGSGSFTLTHFDQAYAKAISSLNNSFTAFDDAKNVTELMRSEENSLNDLEKDIAGEELSFKHELIELYGTPYPDDIGPAGTYPQGYDGPDLVHYAYIESDITDVLRKQLFEVGKFNKIDGNLKPDEGVNAISDDVSIDIQNWADKWTYDQIFNKYDFKTFSSTAEKWDINDYIDQFRLTGSQNKEKHFGGDIPGLSYQIRKDTGDWINPEYKENEQYIKFNFNKKMGEIVKPSSWKSKRRSPGEIQTAKASVVSANYALRQALAAHSQSKIIFDKKLELFTSKLLAHESVRNETLGLAGLETANDLIFQVIDATKEWGELNGEILKYTEGAATEVIPDNLIFGAMVGGGDILASMKGAIKAGNYGLEIVNKSAQLGLYLLKESMKGAFRETARWTPLLNSAPIEWREEVRGVMHELDTTHKELELSLFDIIEKMQERTAAEQEYAALLAKGDRIQTQRHIFRQRTSALIQRYRSRDASFRIFRHEKLERYKRLFDLSAKYTYLAAKAYDYETGLLKGQSGDQFLSRIISSRALGLMTDGEPQYAGSNTGDPGLSSILAEMKADYEVLRSRLGFNNPDTQGTTMSLRFEKFRILPGDDGQQQWKNVLYSSLKEDILEDKDVITHCLQIGSSNDNTPVPGIIMEFSTSIHDGFNVFGNPLAGGDNSFSASNFATKIHGVGIGFEDYVGIGWVLANPDSIPADAPWLDPNALSNTPYVYLIPVGSDIMRSPPLGDKSELRYWNVQDTTIPLPFNIGASNYSFESAWQTGDFLSGDLFNVRKHQAFRAVLWEIDDDGAGTFDDSAPIYAPSKMMNNRLVGRSVWNTKWKLIIPGKTLLNDPNEGLERFINNVSDIKIHFETYSYSGN